MTVRIEVYADDAIKKLAEINKELTPAIDKAIKKGGYAVEAEAKSRCPVDTGRLRASIHTIDSGEMEVTVADETEYGVFVEYGTSKSRSQPFMRPALEDKKELINDLIVKAVDETAK